MKRLTFLVAVVPFFAGCEEAPTSGIPPLNTTVGDTDGETDPLNPDDPTDPPDDPVVEVCLLVSVDGDELGDGTIDYHDVHLYEGEVLIATTHDVGVDGVLESRASFTYGPDGELIAREVDKGDDGVLDLRTTYAHDAAGNLVLTEVDIGADATVDTSRTFTYDPSGLLLVELWEAAAQTYSYSNTNIYDADGFRVRLDYDRLVDGVLDEITTYANDASGKALTEETTNPSDGRVMRTVTNTYDSEGRRVSRYTDDLVIDKTNLTTRTYTTDGNVATIEDDPGADGTPSLVETWTWDCP